MEIEATKCPNCGDDNNTSTTDEWLGKAEHHCYECGTTYNVEYEVKAISVKIVKTGGMIIKID